MICVPTNEYGRRADFYDYINSLIKRPHDILAFVHDRSPAHGRNVVIKDAFKFECSHILYVDDDMTPDTDALERLLKHNVDIVTGLYLTGSYPHQPLIFDFVGPEGALATYLDGPLPELIPIQGAGLGFCLIKMNVFERLDPPYFRLGELDPEQWCDDIGFFYRAHQAGIKAYCDTTVCVGHIKSQIVKPKFMDGKWYTEFVSGGHGSIATPQLVPKVEVPK